MRLQAANQENNYSPVTIFLFVISFKVALRRHGESR